MPGHRTNGMSSANVGAEYDEDEMAFMRAMHRYKIEQNRPYPTWSEVLGVLISLGYRKTVEAKK